MSTLPDAVRASEWAGRTEAAVLAVATAGVALMALRGSALMARDAEGGQLKTVADEAAEGWVLGYLGAAFPGDVFLSEEAFEREGKAWVPPAAYWTVDALDGTRSYADGYDGFCVQVAYVRDGEVCVGAIAEPAAGRCYLAARGAGGWVREAGGEFRRLEIAHDPEWPASPVFVDSTRPAGVPGEWFRAHDARFLELGSIGLKICRVADGSAHVFLKALRFKLWDVAPGDLLLREAGGALTLWNGERVPYGTEQVVFEDVLAAPAALAPRLVAEIAH
ncbi:MAG TPA: inositol monophosphatase family protein [Longimicrobium sp.]